MKDDNFTPSQVGTLLEDMNTKIQLLYEVVVPLRQDMTEVKERLDKIDFGLERVEIRLGSVEDAIRLNLVPRITRLESKAGF